MVVNEDSFIGETLAYRFMSRVIDIVGIRLKEGSMDIGTALLYIKVATNYGATLSREYDGLLLSKKPSHKLIPKGTNPLVVSLEELLTIEGLNEYIKSHPELLKC